MRFFPAVLAATLFIFVAGGGQASDVFAEDDRAKVLAILPLTGELAGIGQAVKNGVEMGAKELQAPVSIAYEDDGGLSKNTVSALRNHLASNKPDIVITASSGTSKSIAPIVEAEKIPLIAIATDETISKETKYSVNFWVTPDKEAEVLVKEAVRRGYKNIAIFTTHHDGTHSILRKFNEANNGEINVSYEDSFDGNVRDFRSIISKFKRHAGRLAEEESIDAIFINVFFGQIGLFARQLREMGVDLPLFNIELAEDENEVRVSQGALVDTWYVQADDAGSDFLKRYAEAYPGASTFGSANGYDAIGLIQHCINNSFTGSEGLRECLHNVRDYQGVMGAISSTSDNRFDLPATVKVVTQQGFEKSGH